MKSLTLPALALLLTACAGRSTEPGPAPVPIEPRPAATAAPPAAEAGDGTTPRIEWGMVLHGGAGTIRRGSMTAETEAEYRGKMEEALRAGYDVLEGGGSGIDAVVAAITILEDSPLFNAGKGAVFTGEGTNTLDASIMSGSPLAAGAVAGVTRVKNPILLARLVMEESPHVLLAGAGAEEFARVQGVELVDPSYFFTERRWRSLERVRERAGEPMPERPVPAAGSDEAALPAVPDKFGTVGVVALDRAGAIAAGTSTGGTTNKKWGRVGDSPIVGAGTYAGTRCGVSSTGTGEYFIRNVVAYDICARMEYRGIPLEQAAREVIFDVLEAQRESTGGIIALDDEGHVVMMMNTAGMYRGYVNEDGVVVTEIYD